MSAELEPVTCGECRGTGEDPSPSGRPCPVCNGLGKIIGEAWRNRVDGEGGWHPIATVAALLNGPALEAAGFELVDPGYWRCELGDGLELALEPCTFGRFYLAVYRNRELVLGRKVMVAIVDVDEA